MRLPQRVRMRKWRRRVRELPPPAMLLALYVLLVALGAFLLKLPIAHHTVLTFGDALFTSASAVTVTGLVVVDTGSHFTLFGQIVIAALIQLGGLGLMTFAVLILSALGLSVGLPRTIQLREDLGRNSLADITALVRLIGMVVITCEVVGAMLLMLTFVPAHGWAFGSWSAIFHSISAFNNAGFALYPDSLTGFATDPVVNLVVPALFITGGIGFAVIADIWRQRAWAPLVLHSKLMLVGTLGLIVWAVLTFATLEWNNPATLGQYAHWWEKAWVSWFSGTTPRTAGFNTIDYAKVHDATSFMTVTLMLVGGGPTSTAGGIKVTTFIALLLATVAFFRRSRELTAFGRSIPIEDILRVTALVSVAILTVAIATFLALLSHDGEFEVLVSSRSCRPSGPSVCRRARRRTWTDWDAASSSC